MEIFFQDTRKDVSRILAKSRQLRICFQMESACFSAFLIFFLKTKYSVSPIAMFKTASMRQGCNESHLKHSSLNFSKTSHKHFGFSDPPLISLSFLISIASALREWDRERDLYGLGGSGRKMAVGIVPRPKESGMERR